MKLITVGKLVFFWYRNEGLRPHVHVRKGNGAPRLKIWLDTLETIEESKVTFNVSSLRKISETIQEHREKWTALYSEEHGKEKNRGS